MVKLQAVKSEVQILKTSETAVNCIARHIYRLQSKTILEINKMTHQLHHLFNNILQHKHCSKVKDKREQQQGHSQEFDLRGGVNLNYHSHLFWVREEKQQHKNIKVG